MKKQSVYQRKNGGLNLVKSSMLYVQGDEEEGKEIAKIVASVPMNMILSKNKNTDHCCNGDNPASIASLCFVCYYPFC